MNNHSIVDKLKKKWGINRTLDIVLILAVFSLAGASVLKINTLIMGLLGITHDKPLIVRVVVYILLIPPLYQILLLAYGFLLGQFYFFWEKEKRLAKWMSSLVSKKSSSK